MKEFSNNLLLQKKNNNQFQVLRTLDSSSMSTEASQKPGETNFAKANVHKWQGINLGNSIFSPKQLLVFNSKVIRFKIQQNMYKLFRVFNDFINWRHLISRFDRLDLNKLKWKLKIGGKISKCLGIVQKPITSIKWRFQLKNSYMCFHRGWSCRFPLHLCLHNRNFQLWPHMGVGTWVGWCVDAIVEVVDIFEWVSRGSVSIGKSQKWFRMK